MVNDTFEDKNLFMRYGAVMGKSHKDFNGGGALYKKGGRGFKSSGGQ